MNTNAPSQLTAHKDAALQANAKFDTPAWSGLMGLRGGFNFSIVNYLRCADKYCIM
jgi:hypothetical protein